MDVETIMENCPITIPTVHTYKYYSNYYYKLRLAKSGSKFILQFFYRVIHSVHVCSEKRDMTASGSGM